MGPEFAEREGTDRLVGGDECVEGRRVDAAVRMGDKLHRDAVGPRAVGGEGGQLVEVGAGQKPAGGVDLLLEQVEVVEQPIRRRADASAPLVRCGEQLVGVNEHAFVVRQPREQPAGRAIVCEAMGAGDQARMSLQLLDGEQLAADGTFASADGVTAHRDGCVCRGVGSFELRGVLVRDDPRREPADHVHQ